MSQPNPNWMRWIVASLNKHFDDNKGTYVLSVEGQNPRATSGQAAWAELRVDGPYLREVSKDYWQIFVEVNVLLTAQQGHSDLYAYQTLVGKFTEAFTSVINVYKYGGELVDNGAFVGCLSLLTNNGERIQVSSFGQIDPDVGLMQGCVEGHYQMYLTGA